MLKAGEIWRRFSSVYGRNGVFERLNGHPIVRMTMRRRGTSMNCRVSSNG